MSQNLITIDILSRKLSISPSTIHRWARLGIIHKYRPFPASRTVYYDLEEIVHTLKHPPHQPPHCPPV